MNRKIKLLKNFATFPCWANTKMPATKNGFKDAKFNNDANNYLAQGFNIGISCEMSGLFVLDLDVDIKRGLNGIKVISDLEKSLCPLPLGLVVVTPRGGLHLYYSSKGIINPVGKIGDSCDCKYRGYVIGAGSQINGRYYEVINGLNPDGTPILPVLPKIWLDYINKPNYSKSISSSNYRTFSQRKNELIDGDFKKLYTQCSFIQRCIKDSKELSEPEWHMFGRIMSKLANGLELFDYYSRPYPKYNQEETYKKFQNASKYAVSCNSVSEVFTGCKTCKKGKINER